MTIAVLGSGAFGTALAVALARKGPVTLWTRSARQFDDMSARRENTAYLPGVTLPEALRVTDAIEAAAAADTLLLAIPMQKLRVALAAHSVRLGGRTLVACCKGIEMTSGLGPLALIDAMVPDATSALLTGPSFAGEIAQGLPTALTLACADDNSAETLQRALTTETIRIYRTTDIRGAEIGGALKNVMAIACGATIGAGLGNSARAALMTRGYAEMVRMATAQGGQAETLAGLSGFGDLALTCTSEQSRNFRLGLAIGRGESFDSAITVEGAATARAVAAKSAQIGIDMPITRAVVALLDQKQTLAQVMADLLGRALRPE